MQAACALSQASNLISVRSLLYWLISDTFLCQSGEIIKFSQVGIEPSIVPLQSNAVSLLHDDLKLISGYIF